MIISDKMTETKKSGSGVDELGVSYSEYPKCPNPECKESGRVGRNHIGKGGSISNEPWYCYGCCQTFRV
jgi:hypothetical protein